MVWKKHRRWMADWRDAEGKRRRRSFPTKKQAVAHAARAASKARRSRQKAATAETPGDKPPPESRIWRKWRDQYLATKQAYSSPVLRQTHRHLTLLIAHLPHNQAPENLGPQHLSEFRATYRQAAPGTKARYLSFIRTFFLWLHRAGLLPQNVDWLWPSAAYTPAPRTTTLDPALQEAIEQIAPPAVKYIYMLGRHAGCRIGETQQVQAQDFHPRSQEITIRSEKGYPHRTNPTPAPLTKYLSALTAGVPPQTNLTTLFSKYGQPIPTDPLGQIWRKWAKKMGLHHIRPHDLRRTLATQMAPHCSIVTLMQFFGWKNVRSAMHYVHNQTQATSRQALTRAYQQEPSHEPLPPL